MSIERVFAGGLTLCRSPRGAIGTTLRPAFLLGSILSVLPLRSPSRHAPPADPRRPPAPALRQRHPALALAARLQLVGLPRQGRGAGRVQALRLRLRSRRRLPRPRHGGARPAAHPRRSRAKPRPAQDVRRDAARRRSAHPARHARLPRLAGLGRGRHAARRCRRPPRRGRARRAGRGRPGHGRQPAPQGDGPLQRWPRGRRDRPGALHDQQRRPRRRRCRRPGDRRPDPRRRGGHGQLHERLRRLPRAGAAQAAHRLLSRRAGVQRHRRARDGQAAQAAHRALRDLRRRHVPAPRPSRPRGQAADAGPGAGLPGRPPQGQAGAAGGRLARVAGLRRPVGDEVGRPAARGTVGAGLQGRAGLPRLDPRPGGQERAGRRVRPAPW